MNDHEENHARPRRPRRTRCGWHGNGDGLLGVHHRNRALVGRRFLAKVTAARSFAGRVVNVQRRRSGIWVTLEHVRLGFGSQATFRAPVLRGTSTLRVVITQTQAGAGYLAGISRSIVYHRA